MFEQIRSVYCLNGNTKELSNIVQFEKLVLYMLHSGISLYYDVLLY